MLRTKVYMLYQSVKEPSHDDSGLNRHTCILNLLVLSTVFIIHISHQNLLEVVMYAMQNLRAIWSIILRNVATTRLLPSGPGGPGGPAGPPGPLGFFLDREFLSKRVKVKRRKTPFIADTIYAQLL